MSSVTAACPFCNAELPPVQAQDVSRIPCPRCGEPLPSERFPVEPASAIAAGLPPRPVQPASNAQSKQQTLRILLSIMVGMAVIALIFALFTVGIRRDRDPKPKSVAGEPLAQAPAQLLGLAYLPKGTNVVAGLHLNALGQTSSGAALLTVPQREPIARMLSTLELLGLSSKDVDHVVLGYVLEGLSLTTVIVTRKPYDAAQVKEAVQKQVVSESMYRGKSLYKFAKLPQVPKLWCADSRVLVYTTLRTDDLDRIPASISAVSSALTPRAQKALVDRLGKQSRVWAAGDLEPAKDLGDVARELGFLTKDQARLLALVRSFAVGITADDKEGLTLVGNFFTGNAAATQELRKFLEDSAVNGAASQKAEAPPVEVVEAEAQWVTWQVRADAATLREAMGQFWLGPRKEKAGP